MKKAAMLFLFLLLFIPEFVTSQEPKSPIIYHSITYEMGANWLKEENLFPIVYRGAINGLTYRFEKTGKNYNEVTATLRYGKLKANQRPRSKAKTHSSTLAKLWIFIF